MHFSRLNSILFIHRRVAALIQAAPLPASRLQARSLEAATQTAGLAGEVLQPRAEDQLARRLIPYKGYEPPPLVLDGVDRRPIDYFNRRRPDDEHFGGPRFRKDPFTRRYIDLLDQRPEGSGRIAHEFYGGPPYPDQPGPTRESSKTGALEKSSSVRAHGTHAETGHNPFGAGLLSSSDAGRSPSQTHPVPGDALTSHTGECTS